MPNLIDAARAQFPGKQFAFHWFWKSGPVYQLTIVVDGETGHYPVEPDSPDDLLLVTGPEVTMRVFAERLNREHLNLTDREVALLVAQSMRNPIRIHRKPE